MDPALELAPAKLGGGGERTLSAAGASMRPIDLPVTANVPELMLLSTCAETKRPSCMRSDVGDSLDWDAEADALYSVGSEALPVCRL